MLVAPLGERSRGQHVRPATAEGLAWSLEGLQSPLILPSLPRPPPIPLRPSAAPGIPASKTCPKGVPLCLPLGLLLFALSSCFPSSMPAAPAAMETSRCADWVTSPLRHCCGFLLYLGCHPNSYVAFQGGPVGPDPRPLGLHSVPRTPSASSHLWVLPCAVRSLDCS